MGWNIFLADVQRGYNDIWNAILLMKYSQCRTYVSNCVQFNTGKKSDRASDGPVSSRVSCLAHSTSNQLGVMIVAVGRSSLYIGITSEST